jgi:hypothetical protein
MTRLPILCLALASLVLSSHRAWAAPIKACDFITVQTASSVFGATVGAGDEESALYGSQQCVFTRTDPASAGLINLGLTDAKTMAAGLGQSDVAALIRLFQQTNPYNGKTSEAIPSLGEWNSYVWDKDLDDHTLTVLYHGKVLILLARGSKNPNLKAAIVQAMRQAMQKL